MCVRRPSPMRAASRHAISPAHTLGSSHPPPCDPAVQGCPPNDPGRIAQLLQSWEAVRVGKLPARQQRHRQVQCDARQRRARRAAMRRTSLVNSYYNLATDLRVGMGPKLPLRGQRAGETFNQSITRHSTPRVAARRAAERQRLDCGCGIGPFRNLGRFTGRIAGVAATVPGGSRQRCAPGRPRRCLPARAGQLPPDAVRGRV